VVEARNSGIASQVSLSGIQKVIDQIKDHRSIVSTCTHAHIHHMHTQAPQAHTHIHHKQVSMQRDSKRISESEPLTLITLDQVKPSKRERRGRDCYTRFYRDMRDFSGEKNTQ